MDAIRFRVCGKRKEEDGKFRRIVGTVGVGGAVSVLLHVPCDLLIHGGRGDDGRNRDVVSWSVGGVFGENFSVSATIRPRARPAVDFRAGKNRESRLRE